MRLQYVKLQTPTTQNYKTACSSTNYTCIIFDVIMPYTIRTNEPITLLEGKKITSIAFYHSK